MQATTVICALSPPSMLVGFFSPRANTHLGDCGLRGIPVSPKLKIWHGFSTRPLSSSVYLRRSKYLPSASSSTAVALANESGAGVRNVKLGFLLQNESHHPWVIGLSTCV